MAVSIKIINDQLVEVNGKSVFKDTEGNWCTNQEMNTEELKAFTEFRNRKLKVNPRHN